MRTGRLILAGRDWARVTLAERPLARLRGLLGREALPSGEALLIPRCGAIHTVGMRFALDVVFFDRHWRICRVCRDVRPGRLLLWGGWRAAHALECAAGGLDLAAAGRGARGEFTRFCGS